MVWVALLLEIPSHTSIIVKVFFSFTAIVFVNKLLYSSEKSVCLNISTELLRQVCSVAAAAVIRTKQALSLIHI